MHRTNHIFLYVIKIQSAKINMLIEMCKHILKRNTFMLELLSLTSVLIGESNAN